VSSIKCQMTQHWKEINTDSSNEKTSGFARKPKSLILLKQS
jgi:hypothetical protein